MPWQEVSVLDARREFVHLARDESTNRRELCRRFGISATTGYKWLNQFCDDASSLADQSRRPHGSPNRTSAALEAAILQVRDDHPAWGARKIARCLERDNLPVPAVSTIHAILQRHGRVTMPGRGPVPYKRFEHPAPNAVWQMDFKGRFRMAGEQWCHALTIVDDHSRYCPCLKACGDERTNTVQGHLRETFGLYGLPDAMLVDNGSPWGGGSEHRWTRLGVWLLRLGVDVIHSRPFHPQTRGKNERFHRTLKAEVLACKRFTDLDRVQTAFDRWRNVYNLDRPHQALDQNVPADRYRPSTRSMPETLPDIEYDQDDVIRKVSTTKAYVSFKGILWKVPQAFRGQRVAIRPGKNDGSYGVYFGAKRIADIDLHQSEPNEKV